MTYQIFGHALPSVKCQSALEADVRVRALTNFLNIQVEAELSAYRHGGLAGISVI